ncbi:UNVERIFIED_CONTAM: hypothetical protein GTU68_007646, partial [Idotea baltica]|nr:hypothetical protein [Idotea baltica]
DIARAAGKAILEIYNNPSLFAVDYKADKSPLTAADKAANEIICSGLMKLTPEIPIISEENKELPFEQRREYSYCWLVDPLDGTKEFIKRNGEFTVNIALILEGAPVLGVLYIPINDLCYFAAKDLGAFRLEEGGDVKLTCPTFDISQSGLRVLCSRSHLNEETQNFVDALTDPVLIPKGSALKFSVVAEGEGDVYPRIGPTMEWDTAAAHILLEEAGGGLFEFETRKPLTYNKASLLNPNFVAFGKGNPFI